MLLSWGTQDLQLWHAESRPPIRGGSQVPCIGSMESKPLAHEGDPNPFSFKDCESSSSGIGSEDIGEIPLVAKVVEMNSDEKSRERGSDVLSVCITQKFPNLVSTVIFTILCQQ